MGWRDNGIYSVKFFISSVPPAVIKVFSGVDGDVRAEYAPLGGDFQGGVCVAGIGHKSRREVFRAQSEVTVGGGAGPEISPTP